MNWHEASARVIGALDKPGFAPELIMALRLIAPFDHSVIFAFRSDVRPIALYDDFPAWKRSVMVDDYLVGPYLLDPFYLNCSSQALPRIARLRDLAPDRFYQGEYFRNYYIQTGLAEELCFMVGVGHEVSVVISAMRSARPFSDREFSKLRAVLPFVDAVVRRNWAELSGLFTKSGPSPKEALASLIDHAFRGFGRNLLTQRETEIVEYTLRGHSAEATGQALGIATGTVRIHKRNIYSKLGISSQGELFSRFISTLNDFK